MAELVRLVIVGGTGAIPASACGWRAFLVSHSPLELTGDGGIARTSWAGGTYAIPAARAG